MGPAGTAQATAVHLGWEELPAAAAPPGWLAASRRFALLFFPTSTSSLQRHALLSLFSRCLYSGKVNERKEVPQLLLAERVLGLQNPTKSALVQAPDSFAMQWNICFNYFDLVYSSLRSFSLRMGKISIFYKVPEHQFCFMFA